MTDRREVLVRAAVSVLATGGSRALTHRAVDAAAGVPAGATSNCFRTRADLLAGVLDGILAAETEHYARLPAHPGPDGLARDVATMVSHLVGPARETTVARLALAVEASWDTDLARMLDRGRGAWRDIAVARLRTLGVPDPVPVADGLLALVDGFALDRIRGLDAPLGSDPEAVARALLRGHTERVPSPTTTSTRGDQPAPTPR